jgi:hypothetical protein
MKPIYDIRQQIPQPVAMYEKPYDRLSAGDYPRMMVDKTNPEFLKPYKHKNGKEVVVHSKEEENAFLASLEAKNTTIAPVVALPKAIDVLVEKPVQRHQFEAMSPAEAEKAMEANETVRPKRKYTRKLSA